MATGLAQTLLQSAADNGFTKLSTEDVWNVILILAQEIEGGSDTAATLIASASVNDLLSISDGSTFDAICQKACDIANP